MSEPIEYYFDFLSPYGYLGGLGIEEIAARRGRSVDWRVMLLGISVIKVMGLKPLPETPLKGPYLRQDVPRFFRLLGVPYNPPGGGQMAPLPAARSFTWLKGRDPDLAKRFAQAVGHAHWCEGRDMSTPAAVAEVGATLDIDPAELTAAIETDAVKDALKRHVQHSIDKGVFGAPTFIVDGELFWGADRLYQVDRWLETGGW